MEKDPNAKNLSGQIGDALKRHPNVGWTLLCIVLTGITAFVVFALRGGPKLPSDVVPNLVQHTKNSTNAELSLNFRMRKQDYILLEPVQVFVDLKETTAIPYVVSQLKRECAAKLDILKVEEGGTLKR